VNAQVKLWVYIRTLIFRFLWDENVYRRNKGNLIIFSRLVVNRFHEYMNDDINILNVCSEHQR
jgi:hypothetical protein